MRRRERAETSASSLVAKATPDHAGGCGAATSTDAPDAVAADEPSLPGVGALLEEDEGPPFPVDAAGSRVSTMMGPEQAPAAAVAEETEPATEEALLLAAAPGELELLELRADMTDADSARADIVRQLGLFRRVPKNNDDSQQQQQHNRIGLEREEGGGTVI